MRKHQKSIFVWVAITACFTAILFLPSLVNAGDLEPSAAPGPTMKTLDQIPPTWSQILPASERFELVMGGAAVLDKETGLTWARDASLLTMPSIWSMAIERSYEAIIANRRGWRLPTVEELSSLVDMTQNNPALPNGHPFVNVQSDTHSYYWTSSTRAYNADEAWMVRPYDGFTSFTYKTESFYVWPVRGGYGHDAY